MLKTGANRDLAARSAIVVITTLAIVAVALLLWQVLGLLVLIFAAALLAVTLSAIGDWVSRKSGLPYKLGLLIASLLIAALGGFSLWLLGSQIAGQMDQLSTLLPNAWDQVRSYLQQRPWGRVVLDEVQSLSLGPWAGTAAFAVIGGVADIILVIVGGVYLAVQPDLYRRGLIALVPHAGKQKAAETLDESRIALWQWLKGQFISMAIVGVLTAAGLWLIGMPSALALGFLAGVAEFVPYIGPFLAAAPAILLALSEGSLTLFWVVLLYLAVQQIESNLVMPIVMRKLVYLPPALTVFSIVALGSVFGPLGAILAAPLTVFLYVLVSKLYVEGALGKKAELPSDQ